MAGSIHEGNRLGAGMSHVLEHMLFKGTTTRPGNRIDQEVQEAGGYMNAYTSFDRTVYHIDVPNSGTRVALDILCDIMQHATLPEAELEKEKEVILREMDMNIDDPGRRSSRRLFESAYTRSPYRFTVIGYPDLFNELKRADILDYYHEKYAPNNVFFVVAGDIVPAEVTEQIRQAYAGTKARALPAVVLPGEPPQTAPREVIEEAPVEMGYAHFAWHIPDLRHPDVPVLDVLAALLGNGRSSRLYQVVRQKLGLVSSVDTWTYSPGDSGLFGISAMLEAAKFDAARAAILDEVEALKSNHATEAELAKARKQFLAGMLAARKTMQGQAQDLGGSWLAANDLSFSRRYLEAVKKVTLEDVQAVARKYLTAENRTLYALLPSGTRPAESRALEVVADHPVVKLNLPCGLRLLVKEDHRLPFVELRAVFRGGVNQETLANNGSSQLMARMLLKGTRTRTAEAIANSIESVGGSIDSYGGNNSIGVNAEVMEEDFDLGLSVLADVLINPSFPAEAFLREREVQLTAIRAQKDHLLQVAFRQMRRGLFGDAGYGLDAIGTEGSVQALNAEDLKTWHARLVMPENCVLAVFGRVDTERVRQTVTAAFAPWFDASLTPAFAPLSSAESGPRQAGVKRSTEYQDKKQAVVAIGFQGTSLFDPDRYAFDLVQEVCSDLGSRLFMRIRDELGLAYYVGAQNMAGVTPGYFAFYAGTAPEHAELLEKELLAQADVLRREGLTEAELKRAKAKIIGQRKIARQDLGHLAMSTALDELHGLGFTHGETEDRRYEAVTLEEVRKVAEKYLDLDAMVISWVRPKEAAEG